MERMQYRAIQALRWSEKYTKTDMVYLMQAGLWTNLNLVITTLLGLLLSIAFANFLSPQTYGMYQYLLSLAGVVTAFSLTGMNTAVGQAVSRGYEGTLRVVVRAQLQWAIVPSLVCLAVAGYYFWHGTLELGFGLVFIALLTPLVNLSGVYGAYITGKKAFRIHFYFTTGVSVFYYATMFVATLFVKDAAIFVLVNLATNALGALFVYWRTLKIFKPNDKVDSKAIPYGRHLSVLSTWISMLTQLDSILVFHFLGAAQLAVYSFATLIPERIGSLFNFLNTASLPKFANQPLEYIQQNIFPKIVRIVFAGAITTLVYVVVAPYLFHLLFPKYVSAIHYTEIYAPIIALMALVNFVQSTLSAKRLIREIYIVSILQPILLVALQIPLLLSYGVLGMIVARLISDGIAIMVTLWLLLARKQDTL